MTVAAEPVLLIEHDGRVAILTLNRPHALNALSSELRRTLHHTLLRLDRDEDVGAIILTGSGDRAFTAGIDLKEAANQQAGAVDQALGDENPVAAIEQCSTPIIVAVNGLCITGGMEIMLACDIAIASRNAKFADTHVRVGAMPGWGISQRLSRQIGRQRAKEFSLTGNFVDAGRAFDLGLINRVVEHSDLRATALELARDIATNDPRFVEAYGQLIDDGFGMSFEDGLALERRRWQEYAGKVQPEEIERGRQNATRRNREQAGP